MNSPTTPIVTPDSLVVNPDMTLGLSRAGSAAMTLVVTCELATGELATCVLAEL